MVHRPGIENNNCIFGNELSVVDKVVAGYMRRSQPEGIVDSFDLFDNGMAVWEVLLIINCWEAVSAHNPVELGLCLLLNFREGGD